MSTEHLLIEIGTEELPPKALKTLSESLANHILEALLKAELIQPDDKVKREIFASPRRLALLVPGVAAVQPGQVTQRRGPAVSLAFDSNGKPTPAAQGFARSCNIEVDQLERLKTDKGEWLSATIQEQGIPLANLLESILNSAVKRLPIPKRMRWGSGDAEFVRPVHWLVVMHGNAVIPTSVLGLNSNNVSQGHRFHCNDPIAFNHACDYQANLQDQGNVVASFAQRQQIIQTQIESLASSLEASIDEDQGLLDEVTALVEKPVALLGSFDKQFLEVPSECLISAMRDHQKYFHLRNAQGELLPNFITVSNIASNNEARVIAGNERVLRARLSDARFFWDTDRKLSLADQLPKLDTVLFHAKLGSLGQKVERLKIMASHIATEIGATVNVAHRAAELAKADLVTDMVGEFDKLQGVMGHYYADLDGEAAIVGEAIEQHYWPRFAGDRLPLSKEAQSVALADRIDNLVGICGAGAKPSGDKDPYSLRRAALGVLRVLIEQRLELSVFDLVKASAASYAEQNTELEEGTNESVTAFIFGRLTSYYQAQGVASNAVQAVDACRPANPLEFDQRMQAVRCFSDLDEAQDLAAANKRISNILKKQGEVAMEVTESLLTESAEQQLHQSLLLVEAQANSLFDVGDFTAGLKALAPLRAPIDCFFDNVMVLTKDPAQQNNRLTLLKRVQALFLRVADISLLQV